MLRMCKPIILIEDNRRLWADGELNRPYFRCTNFPFFTKKISLPTCSVAPSS